MYRQQVPLPILIILISDQFHLDLLHHLSTGFVSSTAFYLFINVERLALRGTTRTFTFAIPIVMRLPKVERRGVAILGISATTVFPRISAHGRLTGGYGVS